MQLQFSGPVSSDRVWALLAAEIIMEWNPEKLLLKIFTLGQTQPCERINYSRPRFKEQHLTKQMQWSAAQITIFIWAWQLIDHQGWAR